jgi:hypothetical protein
MFIYVVLEISCIGTYGYEPSARFMTAEDAHEYVSVSRQRNTMMAYKIEVITDSRKGKSDRRVN